MGTSDELAAMIGDEPTVTKPQDTPVWQPLCVCGHLRKSHSPSVGGSARSPHLPPGANYHFDGCSGEMPHRSFETRTISYNQETKTGTFTENPTCPCEEFRPVAEVDRPGRYFHQRRPRDPSDRARHPFLVGLRAYRTRISKFKDVAGDPVKRDAIMDRRFRWIDGARVCSMSTCSTTQDVWPVYVTGSLLSELRCGKHR